MILKYKSSIILLRIHLEKIQFQLSDLSDYFCANDFSVNCKKEKLILVKVHFQYCDCIGFV